MSFSVSLYFPIKSQIYWKIGKSAETRNADWHFDNAFRIRDHAAFLGFVWNISYVFYKTRMFSRRKSLSLRKIWVTTALVQMMHPQQPNSLSRNMAMNTGRWAWTRLHSDFGALFFVSLVQISRWRILQNRIRFYETVHYKHLYSKCWFSMDISIFLLYT